jgi:hypothetical protein
MADFYSLHASDNFRLARSKTLLNKASATYNIIKLPKYTFVSDLWFYVSTAFAGGAGGTVTIGFIGNGETADADGFMGNTVALPDVAGMKVARQDTKPGSQGKWFNDASGCVTITIDTGTHTTLLNCFVFVAYSVLH